MRLKLPLFFIFISIYSWSQTNTFTSNGSFVVAAGLTTLTAECWGAGGAGGGNDTSSSAGGGGGGGYSKSLITVSPNTTINYLVGVGGLGSTASGASGSITTFSTVSANGGVGGTSGTGGAAGVGGTGGAGTNFTGGRGSNGSLVLTLLYSGGGGSSAGTASNGNNASLGAGGVAVTGGGAGGNGGAIAGPGANGVTPGGGGGGGLVLLGLGNNKGGNGGNGQIKLTYTCPTYNITGTTAGNACLTDGDSPVVLTSSAAQLPIGNYTVTYNRSSPAATGLTAPMTVTVAGTANFTAKGFTVEGPSSITITAITSGTCTSAISTSAASTANITVSGISVGGTTAGGTTICSGSTSGNLTLSGQVGTVTTWQSSVSPFSTWTNIPNTANLSTYVSSALSQTTHFRAVVKNGACSTANSNSTIVTVNPRPTITTGGVTAPVCSSTSGQNTTLAYSASGFSPNRYSIQWTGLANQVITNFAFAAGGGSVDNILVPASTAAGTYNGVMTLLTANGCSTTQNISLTVNSNPTITTSGTVTAVCSSASQQNASLTYSASGFSPNRYSIQWTGLANQVVTNFAFAAGGGTINTIVVPGNTAAGTYNGVMTLLTANGCSATQNISLTVNANPTITTSGTVTAVCLSASQQNASLAYSASTFSPNSYSIQWTGLANQATTNFAFAAGGGTINTIVVPGNTAAGTYNGVMTLLTANGCSVNQNISLTVNPNPTITTSGTVTAVCSSSSQQNASLTYSASGFSPNRYSIQWTGLANQATTNFAFAAGGGTINTIVVPANTAAGTYNGVMTLLTANGCSVNQNISLTVNTSPTINTNGIFNSVCQSSLAQTTSLNYSSTTGSPINYAIDWIALTDQGATPFPFSSGSGSIINVNIPANATAGTYNGVMTISTADSCPVTQTVSLTVNAVSSAPTASVTQQPSCQNNSGIITVTSPAAGSGYTYSIDGLDFSNTSGVFTGLNSGVYNVKTRNITSGCESPATPLNIDPVATKTWSGNVSASWGDPANWIPAGVPLASDCVTIPDVTTNPIISGTDGTFFANRITIQNNGSLIVEGTNTITVTNEVNVLGNGIFTFENNASLVQVSNAVNTGNITYKRNTTPVRRFDLTHWSSPVTRVPALTLYDFSPGTLYDKYNKYDPVTKWVIVYHGIDEMIKGKGYSIRPPQIFDLNTPQIWQGEFIGVPNNGDVIGPEAVAEKLTFFGNPYPSAIYADQFIYDNSANIYGTLYFWTHNSLPILNGNVYSYGANDYAIYNLSGDITVGSLVGIGAPTPGNQTPPSGYIGAGQGFFARAKTDQRAVFTNSMRVSGRNSQFFKSTAREIEKHRVWLNLTNIDGAFKQLLIAYVTGATNLWDNNYDAVSMDAHPNIDFYSINEAKKLVIQGREIPFISSDTIPLGYRSAIEGEFTIAIDRTDGNLNNQTIYLQDNVTKTLHNLKSGGYKFTTAKGVFQQRFVIRYTDPSVTLGNDDFTGTDRNVYVSVKDKSIKLQATADEEKLQETAVYDVGGKLLYHKKGIDGKEWIITNLHSGPQVLLVKITLDNGKTFTRKVIFN